MDRKNILAQHLAVKVSRTPLGAILDGGKKAAKLRNAGRQPGVYNAELLAETIDLQSPSMLHAVIDRSFIKRPCPSWGGGGVGGDEIQC